MALSLYNTLTRKKEPFRPQDPKMVRMYSCGPTVYDYAHIGNFRAYVASDIIRRYLLFRGFGLKHIMNITDVDDKTITGSRKQGVPLAEYTEKFIKAFFEDLDRLNIQRAEAYPRATEHIDEMVKLVNALISKGLAYRGRDAFYFSISKFPGYGKLAHLEKAQLKAGARVKQDEYDKEHAQDFALWKLWDEDDGDVFWENDIGGEKVKGRPGWHLECSAMSMKHLGPTLDIHSGGVDLVFPHHQNEIAQSEGMTGKPFVRYWLHNEHLMVDGQKMSKNLGNFFTLRDLIKKGHDPMAIRYLLMATHYRQKVNLTEEALGSAAQSVERLREFASNSSCGKDGKAIPGFVKEAEVAFSRAMDDDFNMPEALSSIFEFVRKANKEGAGPVAHDLIVDFDKVLGLGLHDVGIWQPADKASADVRDLIRQREEARKARDWATADSIRDQLKGKGVIIEDTEKGARWKSAR